MTESHLFWGIDLGGTKIEGVVLPSLTEASPICRLRIPTEVDQGYHHVLDRIISLVGQMQVEVGQAPFKLGIGTPGAVDSRTNLIKNSNSTCLIGQPLKDDLEARLRIPVKLANDANCFALAEAVYGAGRGAANVFGVIMGTGVGGGVVIDRKVLNGLQGIAGEWGHNVVDANGPECYCGKRGCVESMISGPALERFFSERSGQNLCLPEIYQMYQNVPRHPQAAECMTRLLEYFGRSLAVVINILDPDVIVLGGGVSNIPLLYSQGRAEVAKYVFNNRLETQIVQNMLGDSAGVFGAALL